MKGTCPINPDCYLHAMNSETCENCFANEILHVLKDGIMCYFGSIPIGVADSIEFISSDKHENYHCKYCQKQLQIPHFIADDNGYYCNNDCYNKYCRDLCIHKIKNESFAVECGMQMVSNNIKRGQSWKNVTCPECLKNKPKEKGMIRDCNTCVWHPTGPNQGPCKSCTPEKSFYANKIRPKKLEQSIFCGLPNEIRYAQASATGETLNFFNIHGSVLRVEKGNFETGVNLKRRLTVDGMTYDEALECYKKGELEYKNSNRWTKASAFDEWTEDAAPLQFYRRKPKVKTFRLELNDFMQHVFENAVEKGWHTEIQKDSDFDRKISDMCNNLHDEVSEFHEAWRNHNLDELCDKADEMTAIGLPPLTCKEEEMADILIRVLDNCKVLDIDIENACRVKHIYNTHREKRHGGKKC